MRQGGKCEGKTSDSWFQLTLPGDWRLDLADVPGCDPESRTIRLTTNKDLIVDDLKRLVGYLGRAHPLVRHAIDRVRHTSFGDAAGKTDVRAAVVMADVTEPTVYCTYLARVSSSAGREYERVVAVRITKSAPPVFCIDPDEWLALASIHSAVSPTGVWERKFADWAASKLDDARSLAGDSFAPIGNQFLTAASANISQERHELDSWLADRAREMSPVHSPSQANLFIPPSPDEIKPRKSPSTPAEHLAAVYQDTSQPARLRNQADALLKIYQQRLRRLAKRGQFNPPEVIPLGLLMVLPQETSHVA